MHMSQVAVLFSLRIEDQIDINGGASTYPNVYCLPHNSQPFLGVERQPSIVSLGWDLGRPDDSDGASPDETHRRPFPPANYRKSSVSMMGPVGPVGGLSEHPPAASSYTHHSWKLTTDRPKACQNSDISCILQSTNTLITMLFEILFQAHFHNP